MYQKGLRNSAPVKSYKLSRQPACRDHTDLLAQHSTHRDLETVPTAWSPQPRPLRHQWSERRVAGQVIVDRLDVCSEIELTPHPGNDRWQ
jgi:hypothetical protein